MWGPPGTTDPFCKSPWHVVHEKSVSQLFIFIVAVVFQWQEGEGEQLKQNTVSKLKKEKSLVTEARGS